MKIIYKIKQIAMCLCLVAMAASCDDSLPDVGGAEQNYNSVYGLLKANTNLSLYYKAIELTKLETTLNTADSFTFFVPTDAAFEAFLVKNGYVNTLGYPDINLVPVDVLKQIVLSHVVKGVKKRVGKLTGVEADYLETGQLTTLANLANSDLYLLDVKVEEGVLKVNGSDKAAVGLDYYGTNGFVHVLDNVISLIPPSPAITSVSQAFASPGDVLELNGANFVNVTSVKFGEEEATFKTVSNSKIEVTVPADFGSYALIKVQTAFGTSNTATVGVKFLLYGDDFSGSATPQSSGGWGGSSDFQSTVKVSRGTYAIEKYADAWSGFNIGFDMLNVADYGYLKISVYPTQSTKILVSLNSDFADEFGTTVTLTAGQWNNISIPFSDLKTDKVGATFNTIFIKEYSNGITVDPGNPSILYFDDIGFL